MFPGYRAVPCDEIQEPDPVIDTRQHRPAVIGGILAHGEIRESGSFQERFHAIDLAGEDCEVQGVEDRVISKIEI